MTSLNLSELQTARESFSTRLRTVLDSRITTQNSGVVAGTYNNSATTVTPITVNAKGQVIDTGAPVTITPAWSSVSGKPTTLSGYGITDAIAASQKGAANGVATLDASGLVPSSQLPSYVDDVLEYPSLANFPAIGEASKIYVAVDTDQIYRWSGSSYIDISSGAGSSDTALRLTTARTIAATGDIAWSVTFDGSANVSAVATMANSGVTAGTYNNSATAITPIALDVKGRVISTGPAVTITPAWSSVTGKPTTLGGYGITDATPSTHVGSGGTSHAVVTTAVAGFMSAADKSKLDGIDAGAQVNTVNSVAGKTGSVTLNSADVGLGDVENKSSATIRSELTALNVTSALGYTPYNSTNPNGYITNSGSTTGNAGTATKLQTARSIAMTGDVSWSIAGFDGSANVTAVGTLTNSGIAAGTYNNSSTSVTPITFDEKGRATGVGAAVTITPAWMSVTGKPTTLAGYGINDALPSTNPVITGSVTEDVYTITGTSVEINPINGTIQTWTLNASSTAVVNMASGQFLSLMVQTGPSYTITWSAVSWVGGAAPNIATSGKSMLTFWNIDGVIYGAKVGDVA